MLWVLAKITRPNAGNYLAAQAQAKFQASSPHRSTKLSTNKRTLFAHTSSCVVEELQPIHFEHDNEDESEEEGEENSFLFESSKTDQTSSGILEYIPSDKFR